MSPDTLAALAAAGAAIAAAIVALVALPFTIRASNAAKAQTQLQREIAEEAAQPYVWVEVRPEESQGGILQLVVGNSGPTFARNIRATIEPPLPKGATFSGAREAAHRRLREGIRALGPGRQLAWDIGKGHELVQKKDPQLHTITVTAEGPHGPVPPMSYDINLAELRETREVPTGSLHFVRRAIEKVADKLDGSD
ncbi:hypothetical protein ACFW53_02500 [Nocardiopsis dassonvillei]|uniref:hypothetical protein n=1 Tax=Nocardiopsis dassonvillei TaxID=2014 RepID=UPI0036705D1C